MRTRICQRSTVNSQRSVLCHLSHDYYFYATIFGTTFFGVVGCDRLCATFAFGCEAVGCDAFLDEGIHQSLGTTAREVDVVGMRALVVGVTYDFDFYILILFEKQHKAFDFGIRSGENLVGIVVEIEVVERDGVARCNACETYEDAIARCGD